MVNRNLGGYEMKKKAFVALVSAMVCTVSVFGMTGCKGSNSNEVEFFSSKSENAQIMKKLVDQFNKEHAKEGVKVVLNTPADAGTVLKTRLTKNDIPDIIAYGGDQTYTELESAGVLKDLSQESYMNSVSDQYMQMVYDVQKDRKKKAYAVPYATNASGVIYNVDKFKELGLKIPKTWDEFEEVIRRIEDAGGQPFEYAFKDDWTLLPPWNSMAPDLAPETFYDERLAGKTTFESTHKEIADKYLELLKHGQKDIMGTGYDDANKAFANGDAYMLINGNWAISEIKKNNPDIHLDMFALPASNDESKNYVTSGVDVLLCASAKTKHPKIVKEFLEFMMKPENNQKYIDDQFAFSPINGVEQKDETVASAQKDIEKGKVANFPDHYYPSGYDLASILSEYAMNYSTGMKDEENTKEFLKNLDTQYDAVNNK